MRSRSTTRVPARHRDRQTALQLTGQTDIRMGRTRARALPAVVVIGLLAACAPASGTQARSTPMDPVPTSSSPLNAEAIEAAPPGIPDVEAARAMLPDLRPAAPEDQPGEPMERSCEHGKACHFGRPWIDTDHDGCDQRSQVLARDLVDVVRKPGRCAVTAGTLHDPYTATTINLSKVQVDHVVALGAAWRSGAASWPVADRVRFANDLRNLLAVDGKTNQRKSDKTADQPGGTPPNPQFHCAFARIVIGIKHEYRLSVTDAERRALGVNLAHC